MTTETIAVTGMTCEHCVTSVTEEVSELNGVTDVAVDLVPGGDSTVTVTADHPLDDQALRGAIAEAGYEVVSR
ncbi:heavy-metal-associated domain-containing protein [Curtobacterium sp. RHCKG23]|uniref:Heavy-metal-associated domain-containing protein n=1 Tax=Curtobacterium citri TaxID=3055139 RepID=A0ABT7T9F1_9MICO|nr:heavy-metal-associated domain-containing protein [Curtobacterium citri]MDM7886186.1 heavy-metal-associated domain-containing protein [Curtobacterium citri]